MKRFLIGIALIVALVCLVLRGSKKPTAAAPAAPIAVAGLASPATVFVDADPMSVAAQEEFEARLAEDPAATLAEADGLADAGVRLFWVRKGVFAWAKLDFAQAWSHLLQWPAPERSQWLVLLLMYRSEHDAADAVAKLAEAGLARGDYLLTLGVIAANVSKEDPEEALRWVESLPESEQGTAVYNLLAEMAKHHPAHAERWALENVAESPQRASLLKFIGTFNP